MYRLKYHVSKMNDMICINKQSSDTSYISIYHDTIQSPENLPNINNKTRLSDYSNNYQLTIQSVQ